MPNLVRVLKGSRQGDPLKHDPICGDFRRLGIRIRSYDVGQAVVHNNCVAKGVRVGDQTIFVTRSMVVAIGSILSVEGRAFRVVD